LLEAFYTMKGKGQLLVCGPAVEDPANALALLRVATDEGKHKDIVDSHAAQCRHAASKAMIDEFIENSVGHEKLDKLVLAAIAVGCMRSARAVAQMDPAGTARIVRPLARMLLEVEEFQEAKVWARERGGGLSTIHVDTSPGTAGQQQQPP
jgi:hypothetical protein